MLRLLARGSFPIQFYHKPPNAQNIFASCLSDPPRPRSRPRNRMVRGRARQKSVLIRVYLCLSVVEKMIHPTAIIHPKAKLDATVRVGPYAVIDADVELGAGCVVGPHVYLTGVTKIGAGT